MDINDLISIIKKKLTSQIVIESINIEDKSFLHKNHPGNQLGKYHLKVTIKSSVASFCISCSASHFAFAYAVTGFL